MYWKTTAKFLAVLCLLLLVSMRAGLAAASLPDPQAPPGFRLVLSVPGVRLYQKDYPKGTPDFVQVIELDKGAAVRLYHGPVAEPGEGEGVYGGDNPRFKRRSMQSFWDEFSSSDPNAFCIANGQFFYLPEDPTRIAFPLKVDGEVVSDGYGINEYPGKKLMLELWADRADIRELTRESLYGSTAPNVIAGLTEEANKKGKFYVGRTFTGIDDRDGDGSYETVFIFNTLSARQVDAADVLKSFGADKVMMLDGGGSTQLICQGNSYVRSERFVPQAVAVAAGPEPTSTQGFDKMERVEALPKIRPTPAALLKQGERSSLQKAGFAVLGEQPEQMNIPPSPISLRKLLFVPLAMLPIAALLYFILSEARKDNGEDADP